jgi:hypothetical protein
MSNIEKEKYPGYLGKYINGKWRKTKELIMFVLYRTNKIFKITRT